ncbi:N-acetylmuramoyl-L-alanine amidase [Georgenia yuyongxinii]
MVVDPGRSDADTAVPVGETPLGAAGRTGAVVGAFAAPGTITGDAVPTIPTRADWGADESLRTWAPQTGNVTGVVVHHTAGANGYTAEAVPGIIRGIYTYHAKSLRWGDIGYDVIVDAYGRAWEGRYGGLDRALIAAHASGVNSTTFGISVMGNFDKIKVPDAAFRTVAQVIAWKFAVHGISTTGTATGRNGAPMKRVVGHRDVGNTACPGAYFYPRLGELAGLVDDYQALLPGDLS